MFSTLAINQIVLKFAVYMPREMIWTILYTADLHIGMCPTSSNRLQIDDIVGNSHTMHLALHISFNYNTNVVEYMRNTQME